MARYLYSVKTVKYGTPTGTNSMPAELTTLPDTVKGSVTLDTTTGNFATFFVDQKRSPIKKVKIEEGELTAAMQFYDFDFVKLAALAGGTAPTSGGYEKFVPSTDYTDVAKALEITLDTTPAIKVNIFNGQCSTTPLKGGGGRDKMLAWGLDVTPLMTTDLAGDWEISEAD